MKKRGTLVVLIALILILSQALPVMAEEKVLKVGAALAFSGPLAFVGNGFRDGVQITADYFNDKGGLKIGNDTYKIEIIDADTKFTADGATTAARRLVDAEQVDLVVGAIAGPQTLGVLSVTEPAKLITLHSAGVTESIDKKNGRKYSFRGWMSYDEIAPGVFKWLKENKKIQKVALLDMDYESSHQGHAAVHRICKKLGLEVVYDEYYEGGTKDLSPFLMKAIAKKPDVIFNTATSGTGWGLLMKQARELGYEGLFAENHPPTPIQTGEIAGIENMQGMIGFGYATDGDMAPEGMIAFKEAYSKKYGSWHEHSTVLAIPFASVLMAIEKAGSMDSDKIVEALESGATWKTPWGIEGTWGGSNSYGHPHQWFAPQYAIEVQGNKAVPVGVIPMSDLLHGWD
jgi:branched-chain amino acid transport system substrate-binding protein